MTHMYSEKFCKDLQQFLQFTERLYMVIVVVCVCNALIAVFAIVSNAVVVIAIWKTASLHRPSYLLIATLAVTDFGVGLAVSPLHILFKIAEIKNLDLLCLVGATYKVSAIFFSGISFFIVTALSVDRLLAVTLGIRYRIVVTVKRVSFILVILWMSSLGFGLIHIANMKVYYATGGLIIFVCLVFTTYNYLKIGCILRKKNSNRQCKRGPMKFELPSFRFNVGQYKRSVSSMKYVCVVFLMCYTPYLCVMVIKLFKGIGPAIQGATYITDSIIFMNSSLNPAIYYWRMPEIRRAVGKLCRPEKSTVVEIFATTDNL